MADTFGALTFPASPPIGEAPIADKVLEHLPSFLVAVLTAHLGPAWASVSPSKGICEHVFRYDPRMLFDESRLPALYIWEASSTTKRIGDDLIEDSREITIYWIADFGQEEHEIRRIPIINAIGKVLARAMVRERDPGWVLASDTDLLAPTLGSNVANLCGFDHAKRSVGQPMSLEIVLQDADRKQMPLRGISTGISLRELCRITTDATAPAAIDATITPNESAFNVVYQDGLPPPVP